MREMRRRGKVKVLTRDSGAMAAPPSEVAAGGMNKWKVLTAVFVVLTVVLAGGLAYVATLPRGTTGAVTYPIGVEIAISGTYATDGPLRRDGAFLAIDQMNDQLTAANSPIRFQRIHEDSGGTPAGATSSFNALVAAGGQGVRGPLSSGAGGAGIPPPNQTHVGSITPP